MAEYKDELLDHDYDGIQEMDNDLPRWWVWLFIISIIWGILYFLYFDILGIGFSSTDAYRQAMFAARVLKQLTWGLYTSTGHRWQ